MRLKILLDDARERTVCIIIGNRACINRIGFTVLINNPGCIVRNGGLFLTNLRGGGHQTIALVICLYSLRVPLGCSICNSCYN